ncbi:MAG: SDR family NAD(P)-dependent oxidoreductase [Anaerolineae bacterium]|nr:SDR family NAD(P)-dependent oxidoreductase [Anaerolineae bacterium]
MKLLAGKNALLTGGSRGIGPVIAQALAHQGVNLALVARSVDRLETVARSLSGLGVRAIPMPANLTAPLLLTRLALPGMLARGSGHDSS